MLAAGALVMPFTGAASAAEQTALGFVRQYSDRIIVHGSVGGAVRISAHLRDLASFTTAMFLAKEAGVSELRAAGNVTIFRAGGQLFEVENLVPETSRAEQS